MFLPGYEMQLDLDVLVQFLTRRNWGMNNLLRLRLVSLCLLAGVGFALPAAADQPPQEPASDKADTAERESTATTNLSGAKIAVDAATGRFRKPTAEEAQRLAEAMQRFLSDKGRYTENRGAVQHANGTTSMVVPLSRLHFMVVKRNDDGSLSVEHVANPDEAAKFLAAKPTNGKRPVR